MVVSHSIEFYKLSLSQNFVHLPKNLYNKIDHQRYPSKTYRVTPDARRNQTYQVRNDFQPLLYLYICCSFFQKVLRYFLEALIGAVLIVQQQNPVVARLSTARGGRTYFRYFLSVLPNSGLNRSNTLNRVQQNIRTCHSYVCIISPCRYTCQ